VPAILRNFLYLDERLTSQYLAQLEGGVYDEEDQSVRATRSRGGEAGAKAGPLTAKAAKGSGGEESTSRTMRQTPEGDYRRLESVLEDQNALQWLDVFDDAVWGSLRRGEALMIESEVRVPSFYRVADMAAGAQPLMELVQAFGEPVDHETQAMIAGLGQINEVMRVSVVAHAAGAPRYKFICPLKRDFLRDDLGSLDGECIVVGSLQRRLKPTERYSLLDDLGLGGLPRAERRRAERGMKKDLHDSVVAAPAALITPLAIYR
jgi:hypothetical protein